MSTIICLMGPTASGKTQLAVDLTQQLPCDIISVDSAMVYRGMDIGTAKPTTDILKIAPHRLIDIRDPADAYSAGEFRDDALREINAILAQGRIPLLVGGTMLYFRVLQQGIASLPRANAAIRADLLARATTQGWESLHVELAQIDPLAAQRIHPHDSQRIQRALEVYLVSGKTITEWQVNDTSPLSSYNVINIALAPNDRAILHARIAARFQEMLDEGFVEEVKQLMARGDLSLQLPSIKSAGYRQVWEHLSGQLSHQAMSDQSIAATRQLAKRQLTWLRSWGNVTWFDSLHENLIQEVMQFLASQIKE